MVKELTKPTLTVAQANSLCEKIRKGLGDVAEWVYELHQGQGWKVIGYDTWKECCEKEFGHSDWWGRNQAKIAEVRKALQAPPATPSKRAAGVGMSTPAPQNKDKLSDRAVTELARVPKPMRETVLQAASGDGKPPTAAAIREAAKATTKHQSNGRPPKQYDRSHWFKQWEQAIGPLVRLVDKIAVEVKEKHDPHHEAVQEHLNAATEEMMAWMKPKR